MEAVWKLAKKNLEIWWIFRASVFLIPLCFSFFRVSPSCLPPDHRPAKVIFLGRIRHGYEWGEFTCATTTGGKQHKSHTQENVRKKRGLVPADSIYIYMAKIVVPKKVLLTVLLSFLITGKKGYFEDRKMNLGPPDKKHAPDFIFSFFICLLFFCVCVWSFVPMLMPAGRPRYFPLL